MADYTTLKVHSLDEVNEGQRSTYHQLTTEMFAHPQESGINQRIHDGHAELTERICRFLAFHGDETIGAVSVYASLELYDKELVVIGGIAGVCVKPEYQRCGIATDLMAQAMKFLRQDKIDLVFLYGDVTNTWLIHWYGKYGFVLLPKAYHYQGKSGVVYHDNDGFIAPSASKKLFQKVLTGSEPLFLSHGRW